MNFAADHSALQPVESTRSLIVANLVTIACAAVFHWPLATLMFPYWVQSVVIGYFSRERILSLQQFSTEGVKINGESVLPTEETKRSTANFFALHYGAFHLAYLAFLWPGLSHLHRLDWLGLIVAAVSFVWNQAESYRRNISADRMGIPNIGTLMFLPYARILPMHLTIVGGGSVAGESIFALLLFSALKTAADVLMHVIEHRVLRKSAPAAAVG
jgi:hypothetical protein